MTLALNKTTLKRKRDQAKLYRRFLPSLELKRQQLQVAWRKSKASWPNCRPMSTGSETSCSAVSADRRLDDRRCRDGTLGSSRRVRDRKGKRRRHVGPSCSATSLGSRRILAVDHAVLGRFVGRRRSSRWFNCGCECKLLKQRTDVLGAALRRVTQRVNLFDKV